MAYIDFHPTIHAMGDEACAAALIEGTLTEFVDRTLIETDGSAFRAIDSLTKVHLPNLTGISMYSTMDDASLSDVKIPKCTLAYNQAFVNNTAIKQMLFGAPCYFYGSTFKNCSSLETLVLAGRVLRSLESVVSFVGTPIANGTGHIYVPRKMLDGSDGIATYETATNWSSFAGQYRYIEDYPEILAEVKEQAPWY